MNIAPMPEAIFPAQIKAVITGAISLINDSATIPGNHDSAPNSANVGRDCMVSTSPIINPVIPTSGSDLYPIIKHCRKNSLNSKGGVTSSLKNLPTNSERFPASSKLFFSDKIKIYFLSTLFIQKQPCFPVLFFC